MHKRLKNVFYCPECLSKGYQNKLKVTHTNEYFKLGEQDEGQWFTIPSIRRRKKCLTCDFKMHTIEMELQT